MDLLPKDIKIVIAEDDYLIAEEISRILKKLNYQVVGIASNGLKAIELTKTLHPDVVLMDIKMPKIDGIEASKRIISEMPMAIIILTAHESKDLVEKASEVGIGAYITKPPKSEEIDRAITIALARNRDLAASQKLVKQLEENEKLLNELNTTKDRLFAIIAHDLRNPVSALSAFSDKLLKDFDEISLEEIRQYISIISQTSRGVYDLLEELLLWSSLQTDRYEFNPSDIQLSVIFDSVKNQLGTSAFQKNITLDINVNDVHSVFADRNMVQTITRNLLSNAIKFTPRKGTITVRCEDDGDMVVVTITDTGVGIKEDQIPELFNFKKQLSTRGTSGEQGTGLGLILCREMVERNNGKIWVKSASGKGSSFIFSLPKSL